MNFFRDSQAALVDVCSPERNDPLVTAILRNEEHAVAEVLYRRYAAGIRFYLRRANPTAPINDSVLSVLLKATRKLRLKNDLLPSEIGPVILEFTRMEADLIRAEPGWHTAIQGDYSLKLRAQVINALFARFQPDERAILMRAYLLNEPDSRIAQVAGVSTDQVREIRTRARIQFRNLWDTVENPGVAVN